MISIPDRGYLTASEALTWLATGEALSQQQLVRLYRCRLSTWGHWWPDRGAPAALKLILQALRARAGLSEHGRYCVIRYAGGRAILGSTTAMRYVHPAVSPEGPALLRELYLRARRSRRAAGLPELAAALADDIRADLRTDKSLKEACRRIQCAILEGAVVAYGQQDGRDFEPLASQLFLDGSARLSLFDRLDLSPRDGARAGRRFEKVRFKTSEIAALRDDSSAVEGESPFDPYTTGAPGRPTSAHLIEAEFERRAEAGERQARLRAEAKTLEGWLQQAHPRAPRLSWKTIENHIRERFRQQKGDSKFNPE